MSSNKTRSNTQAEDAAVRMTEAESDVIRLVNEFPQDASDEALAQEIKKSYHCKKLRAACTQLGLHPQADPSMNHKGGYIKLLCQYRRARLRGEVFAGYPKPKTKPTKRTFINSVEVGGRTKHCGFKLINVLFSPAFSARMVESGALPSTGIEVDATDGRAKYWKDVAMAYDSDCAEFDRITGPPGRYEGIDPRLASHHSSAKLCSIWKHVTSRYEESLARWKQLETKDADFASFCDDLDVLYLHDKLQLHPIRVDSEQLRAPKRARTRNVSQGSENASTDADSDQKERLVERGNFLRPSAVEAPVQCQISSADSAEEPTYRRILPIPNPESAPTQRRNVSAPSEEQTCTTSRNSRTLVESIQQFLATSGEQRSHLDTYDKVICSSQAVRDTMSAIEALKRGNYDRAVVAQAEESLGTIVQVWLQELNKAGQPRAP